MAGTPTAEVEINETLVSQLIRRQFPQFADQTLSRAACGWDNEIYRLGACRAVRLPRREVAAKLVQQEQIILPQIASVLPIPVPIPIGLGVPDLNYPWHWSIIPWFSGEAADVAPLNNQGAARLGEFLRCMHHLDAANAPINSMRQGVLALRQTKFEQRLGELCGLGHKVNPAVLKVWDRGVAAAPAKEEKWAHADMHPRNVIVNNGVIAAIIDWGDTCLTDPALDLAGLWMIFSQPADIAIGLNIYGDVDHDTELRAKAWAAYMGMNLLATGLVDNPRHAHLGAQILKNILR